MARTTVSENGSGRRPNEEIDLAFASILRAVASPRRQNHPNGREEKISAVMYLLTVANYPGHFTAPASLVAFDSVCSSIDLGAPPLSSMAAARRS
jgi:hypothetical protein